MWRHISNHTVITRPIIEPCYGTSSKKCTFLGSQNVYSSKRTRIQMRLVLLS